MNHSGSGVWLLGLWLLGGLSGAVAPSPLWSQELRVQVLSFNIRYGTARDGQNAWPHRRKLVLEVLRKRDWDFVGLQEALRFQLDELEEQLPQLAEVGVGRQDGRAAGEYSAVLFNHRRWAVARCGTFWLSDTPEKPGSTSWGNTIPRIVTWARFIHKRSGQAVWVFNTHFDHASAASRRRSAEALWERLSRWCGQEPVVVTGDFNAAEDSPEMRYLLSSPVPRLLDTFAHLHPRARHTGTFNGFEGRRDGARIDYVLVRGPWRVLEAAIWNQYPGPVFPSDHWPVMAVLELQAPEE